MHSPGCGEGIDAAPSGPLLRIWATTSALMAGSAGRAKFLFFWLKIKLQFFHFFVSSCFCCRPPGVGRSGNFGDGRSGRGGLASSRWDFEPVEPLSTLWRLWKVDRVKSANLSNVIAGKNRNHLDLHKFAFHWRNVTVSHAPLFILIVRLFFQLTSELA